MTSHLFSVHDAAAEAYLPPFVANTFGLAERMFRELVNQDRHPFNTNPEDYTLFYIGTWDSDNAQVENQKHKPILTGIQARARDINEPLPWEGMEG